MSEFNLPDEVILFRSFARLLYNSYRIFNEYKEEQTNYYENANQIFKDIIENDDISIQNYNKCCFILFGNDNNFCGRFSIEYLKKAQKIIKNHYNEFVSYLTENYQLLNFFDFIFEPVINNLYNEYIQELKNENKLKLDNFIVSNIIECNCSICMESMIESLASPSEALAKHRQRNKLIKFDCNHCFHYDCIFNWFMEKQCCPICRKEF